MYEALNEFRFAKEPLSTNKIYMGKVYPLQGSEKPSTVFPNQTRKKMAKRTAKRKLLKAKISLNQTIQKILQINRDRKQLPYHKDAPKKQAKLNEELKILNKTAEYQAKLIQKYERFLATATA